MTPSTLDDLTSASEAHAAPKQRALSCLLQRKALVRLPAPDAGEQAAWSARRALSRMLARLPATLLDELSRATGGYLVVWQGDTGYIPGPWADADRTLFAVALLNAAELEAAAEPTYGVLAQLVDHLLGSLTEVPVGFISRGSSASPAWSDFHRRLLAAHGLGYADDETARRSPSGYFAWAFANYCLDRRRLAALDAQAYRLLHSTIFSEAYWRGHPLTPSISAGPQQL